MKAAVNASGCHKKWPAKLLVKLSHLTSMAPNIVKRSHSSAVVHLPRAFFASGTRLCQRQYASGMGFIDREILHPGQAINQQHLRHGLMYRRGRT